MRKSPQFPLVFDMAFKVFTIVTAFVIILGSTVLAQNVPSALDTLRSKFQLHKNNGGVSSTCQNQINQVLQDPVLAIKMFDSSTKIPEGIASGRIYQLGDFDECINIESKTKAGEIFGKYCLGSYNTSAVELTPKLNIKQFMLSPRDMDASGVIGSLISGLAMAICVPSGCTPDEVLEILDLPSISFAPTSCYSKDTAPELTVGPILTISFLGIMLGIAVLSTLYDIYLAYSGQGSHPIFTAFSLTSNMDKLLKSSSNPDQLLCLNGIKAISMMWVILGHQYSNVATSPLGNLVDVLNWTKNLSGMYIVGATVSVDTFFVVGGLVTVYTVLKAHQKGVKFNVPMYYVHRYLRLTPALAVVILVQSTLIEYLSNGPLYFVADAELGEPCRKHWWSALLYIQNYVNNGETCVGQSWYLSVDMQLFLLSPLVLLPLVRWPGYTLCGLYALAGLGIIVPFVLGWEFDLIGLPFGDIINASALMDYMKIYYAQTYARFGPYVIGMILGYFVFKAKNKKITFKLDKIQVCALWLVSLGGMVACVYAGHQLIVSDYSKWASSLYLAFNRPAWSLCLSFVIMACVSGYGGPIDKFLSHAVFQFLTKLSYSMYLVHLLLIRVIDQSARYPVTFTDFNMMYTYWGTFMFTLAISLLLCLLFESPIIIVEKLIFGNLGQKSDNRVENKSRNKTTLEA